MKSIVKILVGVLALGLMVSPASAVIYINEVLGSTTGTDSEFIELYNSGGSAVDISLWSIELYDSDAGASYGGLDGGSPHVIPFGTTILPNDFFLMANTTFSTHYPLATVDLLLPENSIENSSYTMILKNSLLATIQTVFVTDGGAGDSANDAGTPVTPDLTVGPDGTFLPAGFYRYADYPNPPWPSHDGGPLAAFLEFSPQPAPSATPGAPNIPEPATLALLAFGSLLAVRRRR